MLLLVLVLPLLFIIITLQLLRETRRLRATRGLYEQLAAMQQQHYDRAE